MVFAEKRTPRSKALVDWLNDINNFPLIFLFAFLTFVAFIALLIGGASLAMGTINKDRGWVVFGLKALSIGVLAFIISCIFLWPHLKGLGKGLHNFLKSF